MYFLVFLSYCIFSFKWGTQVIKDLTLVQTQCQKNTEKLNSNQPQLQPSKSFYSSNKGKYTQEMITELCGRHCDRIVQQEASQDSKEKVPKIMGGIRKGKLADRKTNMYLNLPIKEYSEAFNPERLYIQYYYILYACYCC